MHVLLDVHAASNDQPSAVACSIASSHEDLHEVTSIFSCVDLNSQCVFPSIALPRTDFCFEFRSTTTVHSHQEIPPANSDYWVAKLFHPLILNMDRSITTFGSNLASITEVLHEFFIHHAVLDQFLIHHVVLNQFFIQ